MALKRIVPLLFLIAVPLWFGVHAIIDDSGLGGCLGYLTGGFREVASERDRRFLGKVGADAARCRGGEAALSWRATPWLDWQRYRAAGDGASRYSGWLDRFGFLSPNRRGIDGALLDIEYQRIELLKFNLYDNSGTFEGYLTNPAGRIRKKWPEYRLSEDHPAYRAVGGRGPQRCAGRLIRFRTLDGICNDVLNPAMGASGQRFSRNVSFDATFPETSDNELVRNRHGRRLGRFRPDPQIVSRKLLSRRQARPELCREGIGLPGYSRESACGYRKAPHLNVLAAFWIQFVTHDWFSHLKEGGNGPAWIPLGCRPGSATGDAMESRRGRCRPGDRIDAALFADTAPPRRFHFAKNDYLNRAPRTTVNYVTAWWDASQIYGYDERSKRRVKRAAGDRAKLELWHQAAESSMGYLPLLGGGDPMIPQWAGQEAVAFPDNWNIGLSFFHNVFAREHNLFVDAFRQRGREQPGADSGLRDPQQPQHAIAYSEVGDDDLFEVARLVVAAEIAKIHTLEWTTQLLYNEPLYLAMNANWSGLLGAHPRVGAALDQVMRHFARSGTDTSNDWYAAFAAGPGIVGLGNTQPDIGAGVHHFGVPFSFPEEFINAYRLHSMVPDLIEVRSLRGDPQKIAAKIPVSHLLRSAAAPALRKLGLASFGLSMGRQRAGALAPDNMPLFLQNLELPRLRSATGKVDVAALDILRDRERGIPRYNEFRRQYGLRQLESFDDFVDPRLAEDSPERRSQQEFAARLREVYGQHRCNAAKRITAAQLSGGGAPIDDCLGHPDKTLVDNIEDLDAMVGWLAEFARPHGFAISETQFQVFILNASRRLFSDRFFTSGFRPEFYSTLGIEWINNNGPDGKIMEAGEPNGHAMEVSPLKRVLLRTIPELRAELGPVINVFDPWARDRGEYYSLEWKPRAGAENDESFEPES